MRENIFLPARSPLLLLLEEEDAALINRQFAVDQVWVATRGLISRIESEKNKRREQVVMVVSSTRSWLGFFSFFS